MGVQVGFPQAGFPRSGLFPSAWLRARRRVPLLVMMAATWLSAGPARADAIDGAWCSEQGRRLAIEGPNATTGRGAKLSGAYTRHSFAFTVPAGEEDAGAPVEMILQGETRVRVRIGTGEVQIWQRCPPGISGNVIYGRILQKYGPFQVRFSLIA